jgi:outer membrane lipoprotein-sorting protein
MPRIPILFHILLWGFICAATAGAQAGQSGREEARALVRRVETQYQGETSHAVSRMRVITAKWTREMTLEMWSKGRDRFLVRVVAPKKDEGVASLKIGEEMWNYLPNIDRLVKIPSSLMGDSWMGSHLTNDDLVKENQVDKLYDLTMTRKGNIAEITGVPKPNAAVVWGKILYSIDTEKLIPLSTLYFDEDNALVRTIAFEDVRRVSGRWIPLRMIVKPEDKPKERTEMNYDKLEFDVSLSKDFFSLRTLRGR